MPFTGFFFCEVKCKQPRPGLEVVSSIEYPSISATLSVHHNDIFLCLFIKRFFDPPFFNLSIYLSIYLSIISFFYFLSSIAHTICLTLQFIYQPALSFYLYSYPTFLFMSISPSIFLSFPLTISVLPSSPYIYPYISICLYHTSLSIHLFLHQLIRLTVSMYASLSILDSFSKSWYF